MPKEEEEKNEDVESGNSDDDEDMEDINHTALPKEVVRPNFVALFAYFGTLPP